MAEKKSSGAQGPQDPERQIDRIPDEYKMNRQGKVYVLFAGLLDLAHRDGLAGIETEEIAVEYNDAGEAIYARHRALVTMEGGHTYSGMGDASLGNVGRNIQPHVIRMSETRAKARALRDAVNVGGAAFEELGEEDPSETGSPRQHPAPPQSEQPKPEDAPNTSRGGARNAPDRSGKARKSQVDLLKTLAVEMRGENGVERLETRLGKPLTDLTRQEADEWIDRLTPEDSQ